MKKIPCYCLLALSVLLASCQNASSSLTSSSTASSSSSSSEITSSSSSSEITPPKSVYDPYKISSLTERLIPVKEVKLDSNSNQLIYTQSKLRQIYRINNSSIPYIDLEYFLKTEMDYSSKKNYENYEVEKEDEILTVINPSNGSTLSIDFINRSAKFDNFTDFYITLNDFLGHFHGCIYGTDILNPDMTTYDFEYGNEEISLDFADYDLDLYIYQDKYLLPFGLACDLFDSSNLHWTYFEDAFYVHTNDAKEETNKLNEELRAKGTSWMDEEYLEYNYNMLAFGLDLYFGLDERQYRYEDKTVKYLENGAYALLEPYKERLMSTELNVSNDAILELFANELDDGGHDKYVASNLFSNRNFTRQEVCGKETLNTLTTINNIDKARLEKGIDYKKLAGRQVDENGKEITPKGCYKEEDGIAYIQFDEFAMGDKNYQEMKINDSNYSYDTITLFHYANERIQNNPNIKDVIIDLSANGGGVIFACEFISSWLCGGNDGSIRNSKTGSTMNYHISADVNLDGKFTSEDYLSSDINVYVMISNGSFSCGNRLPCSIKDNRAKNTYFIGSRTGGGSCAVTYTSMNYMGGEIRLSSYLQMGRKGSTKDNFISVESGVEADFDVFDNSDLDKFTDLNRIKEEVKANRNHA